MIARESRLKRTTTMSKRPPCDSQLQIAATNVTNHLSGLFRSLLLSCIVDVYIIIRNTLVVTVKLRILNSRDF